MMEHAMSGVQTGAGYRILRHNEELRVVVMSSFC